MNVCVPAYPVLPGVVAVSAGEDVLVEADDGEDVGVQQELAVANNLGRELPHPRLPVGKVHRNLQVSTYLSEIELFNCVDILYQYITLYSYHLVKKMYRF